MIVSLFGIVNTLVLTVFERTRELGMLRAVGMTRTQVRWMIRYESMITALIGAVIGIALGIVLAVLLIARVDEINVAWPVFSLVIFVLLGARRRAGRCRLPGAARGAAEHPRGAPVRVTSAGSVRERAYAAVVRRLRPLSEEECYLRCYGSRDEMVRVVRVERKRQRQLARISGEELRQLFELRLDSREAELAA